MLDYKIKIGLIPDVRDLGDFNTRKGMFEPAKGKERKDKAINYIIEKFSDDKTEFCDLEWLNHLGLLYKNSDCDKVCEYLREQKVDALFIINCNFGNEEVCGQVAKKMGLPVLLWGPLDTEYGEKGLRYTDSQCGLFAISKQFKRYNIPFSYIENCRIEDETFEKGVEKFLAVATMVKNFKNLKITQVGSRLNPFKSVMANEMELTEKFGFNLQTVNMAQFTDRFGKTIEANSDLIDGQVQRIKEKYNTGITDEETLKKLVALVYVYIGIFEDTGADVLTTECWSAMPLAVGVTPCLAMSILADMGYIVTCEYDVHGAVSNVLLSCATRGDIPTLFGEFTVRHPENRNAELLWHCGPFPYSMKDKNSDAEIINMKPTFRSKDGKYTIARFQGEKGKYTLLGGEYRTCEGPLTQGTYMWAEFNNLSKVEEKLINGPYIHHMSEVYGEYTEILKEFCKYVPELEYDPIEE